MGAERPKSVEEGSLPHCQPGSWPEVMSAMWVGGGNGGGTASWAFGIGIGEGSSGWKLEDEGGLAYRCGCEMRMDGVDDMARARARISTRGYEWRGRRACQSSG